MRTESVFPTTPFEGYVQALARCRTDRSASFVRALQHGEWRGLGVTMALCCAAEAIEKTIQVVREFVGFAGGCGTGLLLAGRCLDYPVPIAITAAGIGGFIALRARYGVSLARIGLLMAILVWLWGIAVASFGLSYNPLEWWATAGGAS